MSMIPKSKKYWKQNFDLKHSFTKPCLSCKHPIHDKHYNKPSKRKFSLISDIWLKLLTRISPKTDWKKKAVENISKTS